MSTTMLSATEKASARWFGVTLPEAEESRHERLMSAIRNIIPSPARPAAQPQPWLPGKRWRYQEHEHQNRIRRDGCLVCRGTGEMRMYIDRPAVTCPSCQVENPYAREEN